MKNSQFSILNSQFASILLALFLTTSVLHAATIEVMVDTGEETINALEGSINLPPGLEIKDLQTGNSAILIWIQAPVLDSKASTLSFSGISPGGFRGKLPIFSFSGDFSTQQAVNLNFSGIKALRNDGNGTPANVAFSARSITLTKDDAPPEPFTPIISHSPEIFEGERFVSFLTQDKGLGVAKYEYASSWIIAPGRNDWQEVSSPFVLRNLESFKKIYVRAIDASGNYRVGTVDGPYHSLVIFGAIIFIVCFALFLRRFFRRRS